MSVYLMIINYLQFRKEKKRVEKELLSTFKDESIIVLADWLKVSSYFNPMKKDKPDFIY